MPVYEKFDAVAHREPLIIHDVLAVSYYKMNQPNPLGEYIPWRKAKNNILSGNFLPDAFVDKINRVHRFIESLISKVADQHRLSNYVQNLLKFPNNVTRLVTNEFLFYTETPFSLDEFQLLHEKIMSTAKMQLDNLHLILASFAVKTPHAKVMNVVAYVECGKNAKIQFTVKNLPSHVDPIYVEKGANNQISYLNNVNIKQDQISHLQFRAYRMPLLFSYNHKLLCQTAGKIHFYSIVEICNDHKQRPAKNLFYEELEGAIASKSSEHEVNQLLEAPCSHVVVSNMIALDEDYKIGEVTHADPFYTYHSNPDANYIDDPLSPEHNYRWVKSFQNEVGFGTEVFLVSTHPKLPSVSFGKILFNYYQSLLTLLQSGEWGNQEVKVKAIESKLNKYFVVPSEKPSQQAETARDDRAASISTDKVVPVAAEPSTQPTAAAKEVQPAMSSWLDYILNSMVEYAHSVVMECPSYFSERTRQSSTKYGNAAVLLENIGSTTLLPLPPPPGTPLLSANQTG
jgi:hypothetical protein